MCFPKETKGAKNNFFSLEAGSPPFGWLLQGQGGDKEYNVSLCGDQITAGQGRKEVTLSGIGLSFLLSKRDVENLWPLPKPASDHPQ